MSLNSSPRLETNQLQTSQVVSYESDEEKGKHFVEVWLIDPSWNQNYWKANERELHDKIQQFVGKPAILTPYLHHPHEYEHIQEDPFDVQGNIKKHREIDQRYKIGEIVKIKPLPNSAFAGVIEITNESAAQAFTQGKLPRYVSPAVYNLNLTGSQGEFTAFEPLHIAFVDQPAYGLKARILDACHGKQDLCLRNLGVAAPVMGPSCIAKALDKLTNTFHSSYTKSNVSVASELSLKDEKDSATPSPTAADTGRVHETKEQKATVVSTAKDQEREESKPTGKKAEAPSKKDKEAGTEKESADVKDVTKEEKDKEKEKSLSVDEIKAIMKEQMAEFMKSYKEEQEARLAKEQKRKLIESYVTLDSAGGNKEEWEKRISALMHIPDDALQDFLEQHYAQSIRGKSRSGSNAAKASKVSDFNRGMQQNAQQNVGTAALLLDQETNDRIDRVLSIGRFIPKSIGIVPNTPVGEALT